MRARPILYSAPMVQAILEGRKTQTRRVVKADFKKPCFVGENLSEYRFKYFYENDGILKASFGKGEKTFSLACPYGKPGDVLWVRESFVHGIEYDDADMPIYDGDDARWKVWYRATNIDLRWDHHGEKDHDNPPWKPSIHMPRWASRITQRITGIRVERLQDISESDALAEGVVHDTASPYKRFHVPGIEHPNKDFPELSRTNAREMYAALWDVINGSGAWLSNPWVWVIETETHLCNIDEYLRREAA